MGVKYDIIINYAKEDNVAHEETGKAWVSSFAFFLENFLGQMIGRKANVLLVSDSEKLTEQDMKSSAIFASILSENFYQSSINIERLNQFYDHVHQEKMHPLPPSNRIFKFVKKPSNSLSLPEHLEEILSYNFYKVDSYTGDVTTISGFLTEATERMFWLKMVDICFDAHKVLQKLNGEYDERKDKAPILFLADVGLDLILERDTIKRELQRHGYRVLPDQVTPRKNTEILEFIQNELRDSLMAIHLIGEDYGFVPKDGELSVPEMQYQLSSQKSGQSSIDQFSRIVWINPESRDVDARQEQFIEAIRREAESMDTTDVLQCSLEELKGIIRQELQKIGKEEGQLSNEYLESGNAIYVIFEKKDQQEVEKLVRRIESSGMHALLPGFEKNPLEMRNSHFEMLKKADHVLIFSLGSNERWIKTKVQDVLKSPGIGRKKEWKQKLLVCSSEKNLDTKLIKNARLDLLTWEGILDAAMINKVIDQLEIHHER